MTLKQAFIHVSERTLTLEQALDCVSRGETQEEYVKRHKRLRRLANERDDLEDAIEVLGDDPRAEQKQKRLKKVKQMIAEFQ